MCEYVEKNQCRVTQTICPYVYYCDKIQAFKPSQSMPLNCRIKEKAEIPKGYYKVVNVRKNYLYIDYNDITIKVKNPFDEVPLYVKVLKAKEGYKIRK